MNDARSNALAVANGDGVPPRRTSNHLLAPYLVAVFITALTAWLVHVSATRSVAFDLTGHVESLLPLTRLAVITAPLIVAFRAGAAALVAWLVIGAMNERVALRSVAAAVLLWIPVLDAPAMVDALVVFLAPERGWERAHVPLGLDALVSDGSGRIRMLAQSLNIALAVWVVLVARALRTRIARGYAVAVPAALGAALLLVLLPLLRV